MYYQWSFGIFFMLAIIVFNCNKRSYSSRDYMLLRDIIYWHRASNKGELLLDGTTILLIMLSKNMYQVLFCK